MLLYYITDRSQFAGDEAARRSRLLKTITQAARCSIDYVQLREKDLSPQELETLARKVQLGTENQKLKTAFLINSRTDIALACDAQGVHLPANDIPPSEVRKIWSQCNSARVTIAASCHTPAEVARAAQEGADLAVFGPVFEKSGVRPAGLEALREACREKIPVLALGGVTLDNAPACMQAGAAGIAAIRLFQDHEMDGVVAALRKAAVGPRTSDLRSSRS